MEVGETFTFYEEEWEILCEVNVEAGWELARRAQPTARCFVTQEAHIWREREGIVVLVKSGDVVAIVSAVNRLLLCRQDAPESYVPHEYGRSAVPMLAGVGVG